eukprot:augustus_masked-scaffold_13-processed-gene-7.43-mRNA-1 protein AED:0.10 eAED:0.10 QI:0/-1/0/1/-1/1/1/0/225
MSHIEGMKEKYSSTSPSVRRIYADIKELRKNSSQHFHAVPSEDIFRWNFILLGPDDAESPFYKGRYHGQILLPQSYPFSPPSIIFLTQTGLWEINKKICLSISDFHPEHWQPAWGIRTMLEAIRSCMLDPKSVQGSIGYLETSDEVKKEYAEKSLSYEHPDMPVVPKVSAIIEKAEDNEVEKNEEKDVNNEFRKDQFDVFLESFALVLMMAIFAVLYRKTLLFYI